MKIVQIEKFGGPEVLELIDRPDPSAKAGEMAIDVKACGLNYADLMARAGHYPGVKQTPYCPGFEVAGVVSAVGDGVTNFAVGDKVMGMTFGGGGYCSKAVISSATAAKIPTNIDYGQATALLVQGLTALFLLEEAQFKPGRSLLIPSAAGGVGSILVQLAKSKGAGKIIGLASPNKHAQVKKLGADAVIDYTKPYWSKEVLKATDGKGIDIYMDSQGDLAGEGFALLSDGAHWMIYGAQTESTNALPGTALWTILGRNITVRGYTLYSSQRDFARGLQELVDLTANGKLELAVQSYPLTKAALAHAEIANRKTSGKVVLVP